MPKRRHTLNLEPGERAHGVNVTMREQTTGMLKSRTQRGIPSVALQTIIGAECDDAPGDWRIVSISTPRSIYQDLGRPPRETPPDGSEWGKHGQPDLRSTETRMLRNLGRLDVLEPPRRRFGVTYGELPVLDFEPLEPPRHA